MQKIFYGSLAAILGFYSAYKTWLRQYERAESEISQRLNLEKKYEDESPEFVLSSFPWEPWESCLETPQTVFTVRHIGGRAPTAIEIDPIESYCGTMKLYFSYIPVVQGDQMAYITPQVVMGLNIDGWPERSMNLGDIKKFFLANCKVATNYSLPVHVNYKDRG